MNEIAPAHRLAIYDMDRTITVRGTYADFLMHAVPRFAPWRVLLAPALLATGLGYILGILNRKRLKEMNLSLMLGNPIDTARLAPIVKSYADQVMARNIRAQAVAQIAADRAAGYRIILATASYALYVRAIAHRLGIAPADVIATELEPAVSDTGGVYARIAGENCYGDAKLVRVQGWVAAMGIDRKTAHIRFYSDHVSDAPCLDFADEAIATTPHASLRQLAGQRGWQIVDW